MKHSDWKLCWAALTSKRRYIDMARADSGAEEASLDTTPENMVDALRRDLWRSTWLILLLVAVACAIAFALGKISPTMRVEWPKWASGLGNALAGWATYFALFDGFASWQGTRADERVRHLIFRCAFLPGLFLSVLGAIS